MYNSLEKLPVAYQDVEVITSDGKTHHAYRSAYGLGFTDVDTYQVIDNVIGWRVIMNRDMVTINQD